MSDIAPQESGGPAKPPVQTQDAAETALDTTAGVPVIVATRSSSWPWVFALVFLVGITCVATPVIFIVYQMSRAVGGVMSAPGRMLDATTQAVAEAARPRYDISAVTSSAIGSMQKQSKLVVLDTTIDIDITKQEGLRSWGVYWGTNRVRLVAKENRIQYMIPLEDIGTADFDFDERARVLQVRVPRPRLDEQMVSVQSDPSKCYAMEYSGGWLRWDKADTLRHAQEALRPAVVQQGKAQIIQDEASRAGIEAVKAFLDPMMTTLTRDGIKLDVKYRD